MSFGDGVYQLDPDLRIWKRPRAKPFAYADGGEKRLKRILQEVSDKSSSSPELLPWQTDWPTLYHLNVFRANILRPFESTLLSAATVLELGCGCGAITRYLGETCACVVGVEGSPERAEIASLRCSDLGNVRIVADRIQDLPQDSAAFDVVTLIGVLEYCGAYGMEPVELLARARSFLKPDGTLILAIENKLGLKYFAGVPEDHNGRSWSGITNGYARDGAATWSRKELEAMLEAAGFANAAQYLAVPDYKLPNTTIMPLGLGMPPDIFNLAPLFAGAQRRGELTALFNLPEAWRSVASAGLCGELADSLCYVAGEAQAVAKAFMPGVLAVHFGNLIHSLPNYAKRQLFELREGKIYVKKMPACTGSRPGPIVQVLEEEPYYNGRRVGDLARDHAMQKGWTAEGLGESLRPWLEAVFELANGGDSLPGSWLDLTPFNVIVTSDGSRHIFDQEWLQARAVPLDFILARGILQVIGALSPVAAPAPGVPLSFLELLAQVLACYNLRLNRARLAAIWESESVHGRLGVGDMSWQEYGEMRLTIMPEAGSFRDFSQLCEALHVAPDGLLAYIRQLQSRLVEMQRENRRLGEKLKRLDTGKTAEV